MANTAYVRMSTVKNYIKTRTQNKMRIGEDAFDALDKKIQELVEVAMQRATAERRVTLKERDFA
jgi:histone H3/H4